MADHKTVGNSLVGANMDFCHISSTELDVSLQHAGQKSSGESAFYSMLIVEDDLALARLESEFLKAHGYNVVTVHTGELAITTLGRFIPTIVVLDLELTGDVSGWDVFQALRSLQAPHPIPVLITSSSATAVRTHIRNYAESRWTLDLLPKPYSLQNLLKRIQRMLNDAPS
jgi:DNA-binding response OmpR family regulator